MLGWSAYFLYLFFQLILLLYALIEFSLMIKFITRKKEKSPALPHQLPKVTIQLPLYNEQFVAERLIDSVCAIDYPKELIDIQVLDDSNDETVDLVEQKVAAYRERGINIDHIRREERTGFKAGALAHGLLLAKGEFIAIFDADFVPKKDFLLKSIPYFQNQKVGVVQTRWTHINESYSLLTRLQAIFLNTHFTVEQSGRNESGAYINFNGTAGVWRKTCIEKSGGWQADTLTEDLDLSFRAQMKGWKFQYLIDQESPAELPITLQAFKVQQFRWSKGAAECTKKNLRTLFKTSSLSLRAKIIGAFHLLNSSAYIVVLSFILLSLPMAFFFNDNGPYSDLYGVLNFTYITTVLLFFVFLAANLSVSKNKLITILTFPLLFPLFLMLTMGISLHLTTGVIEGYLGKKSAFVRTPKFNIKPGAEKTTHRVYQTIPLTPILALEILLLIYCAIAIAFTYQFDNIPLLVYEVMFTLGLTVNISTSFFKKH